VPESVEFRKGPSGWPSADLAGTKQSRSARAGRLAKHLATGYRLQRRLPADAPETTDIQAVLEPDATSHTRR